MALLFAAVIWAAGFSQGVGETGVYAPLLTERYHGVAASQMVVKDTAVAMPTLRGSSSEWLDEFEPVPSELRQLATRPSPTPRHRLNASLFPIETRLVDAEAIEAIFTRAGVEENWAAFTTQVKARGWLAFSDPLLADDQLNALVYYPALCGGLCGEGGYVWLRRDAVGAPWRIAKKIVRWMS